MKFSLSLAQETVAQKYDDLQIIPEVLDILDLSGKVVSIDSTGTQTNIAEQIIQSEADYILNLKANQKHLYENIQDFFTGAFIPYFIYETLEKGYGHIEARTSTEGTS